MNVRALVPGKTNVTDFSLLPGSERRLHTAALSKNSRRISFANDFVKLQQIDVIGLQPPKRLFQLLLSRLSGLCIDLGHEKSLLTITIAQRFAHADFADSAVVVPAVVQEV